MWAVFMVEIVMMTLARRLKKKFVLGSGILNVPRGYASGFDSAALRVRRLAFLSLLRGAYLLI